MRSVLLLLLSAAMLACGSASSSTEAPVGEASRPPRPAPELGNGDHTARSVTFTEIASADSGLKTPRDLAFNPLRPDELWIVNNGDDSTVTVRDASTDGRTAERRRDAASEHFMPNPSSIAFGADPTTFGKPGTFATCQESRNTYRGKEPANDFMGPALWSSDPTIFAKMNPNGLGSHLDMLHEAPNCMGIAHAADNIYWTFGGLNNDIVMHDFQKDDGIGNDDHSDGKAIHYTVDVKAVPGVPSHLFFHASDSALYIADTGHGRVAKLDTRTGAFTRNVRAKEPMRICAQYDGASLQDVVPAASNQLTLPSGLEIRGELVYVSDNENGRISAFTLAGERVNYLDTGLPKGALSGMAFGPDKKLYLVDMVGDRVLRVDVKP